MPFHFIFTVPCYKRVSGIYDLFIWSPNLQKFICLHFTDEVRYRDGQIGLWLFWAMTRCKMYPSYKQGPKILGMQGNFQLDMKYIAAVVVTHAFIAASTRYDDDAFRLCLWEQTQIFR